MQYTIDQIKAAADQLEQRLHQEGVDTSCLQGVELGSIFTDLFQALPPGPASLGQVGRKTATVTGKVATEGGQRSEEDSTLIAAVVSQTLETLYKETNPIFVRREEARAAEIIEQAITQAFEAGSHAAPTGPAPVPNGQAGQPRPVLANPFDSERITNKVTQLVLAELYEPDETMAKLSRSRVQYALEDVAAQSFHLAVAEFQDFASALSLLPNHPSYPEKFKLLVPSNG